LPLSTFPRGGRWGEDVFVEDEAEDDEQGVAEGDHGGGVGLEDPGDEEEDHDEEEGGDGDLVVASLLGGDLLAGLAEGDLGSDVLCFLEVVPGLVEDIVHHSLLLRGVRHDDHFVEDLAGVVPPEGLHVDVGGEKLFIGRLRCGGDDGGDRGELRHGGFIGLREAGDVVDYDGAGVVRELGEELVDGELAEFLIDLLADGGIVDVAVLQDDVREGLLLPVLGDEDGVPDAAEDGGLADAFRAEEDDGDIIGDAFVDLGKLRVAADKARAPGDGDVRAAAEGGGEEAEARGASVEAGDGVLLLRQGDVAVDHGGVEVGVAEDLGDALDGDALLVEAGGEGVAERVAVDRAAGVEGAAGVLLDGAVPGAAVAADEERVLVEEVSVLPEVVLDGGKKLPVDGNDALAAALPVDGEVFTREMEVAHAEGADFRDAEASVRHEGEAEAVAVLADGAEEAGDLILGEEVREFFNGFLHLF